MSKALFKRYVYNLFILLLGMAFFVSFLKASNLFISPGGGGLGDQCLEKFDIILDLMGDESVVAADIVIESNMEFVDFKNGDVFEYSAPAKTRGNLVKLLLFGSWGNEIKNGGKVGTLYFNVATQGVDPYVNFVFSGVGVTTDTNLSINGKDILSSVRGGNYFIDQMRTCLQDADTTINLNDISGDDENLEEFIDRFESDHRMDKVNRFMFKYRFLLISILGLIVVVVILFFIKKKNND